MNHKQRVVIDTNLFVSAYIKPHSNLTKKVMDLLRGQHSLQSFDTFLELETVLRRSKFQKFLPGRNLDHFLFFIEDLSEFVDVQTHITTCRDPADNKFLALAVDGGADVILSGDEDLLMLDPFEGVRVLRVEDFG